ncbi:hypothetical protein PRZ48_008145 [Zasmidium cellare]|uniref:RING-type domain-containing protein n=1 Tax=Zasmidium cellare TaxID=395010 RepID=A0ABR0EEM2_ZASCE|nr:hypothetical protein PRZ48_008145 [Zasmidium cellare]
MPSDEGHHTAEGSSRKRLKISRDESRPAGMSQAADFKPPTSPAKPRTAAKVENDLHTNGTPCHHEQAFRSLNDNLDTMRQLITCKICQRFLYEPYALTCGHTFCYSCLSQWLGQNRKKTCPDCRTVIKQQPSPSYLVRELVLVFLSKSELLPDGETSEEHTRYAKEEADIVAKDKANTDVRTGGLFKGCFSGGGLRPLIAIRDTSDHVDRCPQCLHEVEDGRCNTCDVRVRGQDDDLDWSDEDSDEESDDLDHDLDVDDHDFPVAFDYPDYMYDPDDFDEDLDGFDYGFGGPPPPFVPSDGPVSDVSDEEDDDDDDPSMNGFIDDGPNPRYDQSSDINEDSDDTEVENVQPRSRVRRAAPIVVSDDEEEDEDEAEPIHRQRRRVVVVHAPSNRESEAPSSAVDPSVISDDDDDDDEGPVTASQRSRGARRTNPYLVDDEDDEDESDNNSETNTRPAYGGFSPPQYDLTGDSDEEEHEHDHDYHDYHDHFDNHSATSGPTEQSMNQYDFDDGEDDGSDEQDGWGSGLPSALVQDQFLTRAIDTPADDGRMPPHEPSHRLDTLGSRRSRFAVYPLDAVSAFERRFGDASNSYRRRLQPQNHPRRSLHVDQASRSANPAFQPVRPAHPFQLDNTLARLNRNTQPVPHRYSASGSRHHSNLSSQSSVGGVSIGSTGSGSSGSSMTVRADDGGNGSRRRRFAEIEDDESEY